MVFGIGCEKSVFVISRYCGKIVRFGLVLLKVLILM